jgi:carbamoylphosphate synthase large subunit
MGQKKIYILIPQQYYPNGINKEGTALEEILNTIQRSKIKYPLIAKPDIGLRGSGVKKNQYRSRFKEYAEKSKF